MSDTILVTGACGFIGSHFIRMLTDMNYDGTIVIVDKLTYAGKKENLEGIPPSHYDLCIGDITSAPWMDEIFRRYKPHYVVNFAAESHVDRSIVSSAEFAMTNFIGVQVLLDISLQYNVGRFLQVSTDEVYGDVADNDKASVETDLLVPSSPYSASKAAADLLALSYVRTHKMDVVITRCTNNFGPYQYPEKLIPVVITKAMAGEKVPVYGTGENMRDWIYVTDHCSGIWAALTDGEKGEVYNFAGGRLVRNIDIVKKILRLLGKGDECIQFVEDRKGHDVKYWMSYAKAKRELDWTPIIGFDEGLARTVEWYRERLVHESESGTQ